MNEPEFKTGDCAPRTGRGDRVYNKCEIEECLNAGEPYQILGSTHILCRQHLRQNLEENEESILEEWLEHEEYSEPKLFDEFGDKIIY